MFYYLQVLFKGGLNSHSNQVVGSMQEGKKQIALFFLWTSFLFIKMELRLEQIGNYIIYKLTPSLQHCLCSFPVLQNFALHRFRHGHVTSSEVVPAFINMAYYRYIHTKLIVMALMQSWKQKSWKNDLEHPQKIPGIKTDKEKHYVRLQQFRVNSKEKWIILILI